MMRKTYAVYGIRNGESKKMFESFDRKCAERFMKEQKQSFCEFRNLFNDFGIMDFEIKEDAVNDFGSIKVVSNKDLTDAHKYAIGQTKDIPARFRRRLEDAYQTAKIYYIENLNGKDDSARRIKSIVFTGWTKSQNPIKELRVLHITPADDLKETEKSFIFSNEYGTCTILKNHILAVVK